MEKNLHEKELNEFINKNQILGVYGDSAFGKTLFIINTLFNSLAYKNTNYIYITKDDILEVKTKIVSSCLKEDLNNTNVNFYNSLKKESLKNLKILKVSTNIDHLLTILTQHVDKNDNNIIFIDDLDKIIENFGEKGELFLEQFKNKFINSKLIYSFKFPALTGFAKKTNLLLALRNCYNELSLENLSTREKYNISLEDKSYSFKYSQKFFIDYASQCSCGAVKTFGKNAIKNSIYHLSFCDLYKK